MDKDEKTGKRQINFIDIKSLKERRKICNTVNDEEKKVMKRFSEKFRPNSDELTGQ